MNQAQQQLQDLYNRAEQLRQTGRQDELAGICEEILKIDPQSPAALKFLAVRTLGQANYADALKYLRPYCKVRPSEEQMLLGLGVALEETGKYGEAKTALQRALKINENNAFTYTYLGSVFEHLDEPELAGWAYSFGIDLNPSLKVAPSRGKLPKPALERIEKSNVFLKELGRKLHAGAVAKAKEKFPKGDFSRIEKALWRKLHDARVGITNPKQQPLSFYIPNLGSAAWFEAGEFPWARELEKETVFIRNEVLKNLRLDQDAKPYLQAGGYDAAAWGDLIGSKDWAAVHFYDGMEKKQDMHKRFPYTAKVLEKLPLFRIKGKPVEALFSILKPKTKIPPHFGTSNARLTVHLPLVVPAGCVLKAGGEERTVAAGKVMIFDDSFFHHAWNDSGEVRIVLIFEVWHPELREEERFVVEHSYAGYEQWMMKRDHDALLNV